MSTEEHVLVRVRSRWPVPNTVCVNDHVYEPGDTFAVPARSVDRWLSDGRVELADESPVMRSSDSVPTMQRRTKENTFDHWFSDY
ncbi:hypothetical protein [Streptomyces sp. LN499]|uniref:hypothetical protein n=1 Tax=Streptomyces sp. LN499 TaxID=3112977 RepID=UPI0037240F54